MTINLIIGTYSYKLPHSKDCGKGMHLANFSFKNNKIRTLKIINEIKNPSYFQFLNEHSKLYIVQEMEDYNYSKIFIVDVDKSINEYKIISHLPTYGELPCHLSIDKHQRMAFVSNYNGGQLSVYPLDKNGNFEKFPIVFQHQGSSVHNIRQTKPHVHCSIVDPDNKKLLVADLGLDKIIVYKINHERQSCNLDTTFKLKDGSGPRHITFLNKKKFFIINELNSSINFCYFDKNEIKIINSVSSTRPQINKDNFASTVVIHKNEKFLYASNRGHNTITLFYINERLIYVKSFHCNGETPRDIVLDPTGNYLFVANQDSNTIDIFIIDNKNGFLHHKFTYSDIKSPTCIKFI